LTQFDRPPAGPVESTVPAAPNRRRLPIIIGCVVVLLVAGGITSALLLQHNGSPAAASLTDTATSAAPPPTSAAPTATKYVGKLQDLAIIMPAGSTRQKLRMGGTDGSLDLDAVLLEYDAADRPAMRTRLSDLEFERGLFLAWNDTQGFLVYLQIWQFHYERQSAEWFVADAGGISTNAESTASLENIEGGKVITTITPNGRRAAHARFVKGDLSVMLSIFKTGPTDLDYLKRLAAEQYQRLP
jgi:hypothetical protein